VRLIDSDLLINCISPYGRQRLLTVCILCVTTYQVSLFLIRTLRILVYRGRNCLPHVSFLVGLAVQLGFDQILVAKCLIFFVCVYMHSGFWRTKAYAANMLFWPIRAIRCTQDNQLAYFYFITAYHTSSVVPRYPGRGALWVCDWWSLQRKILSPFPLKMVLLPFTT